MAEAKKDAPAGSEVQELPSARERKSGVRHIKLRADHNTNKPEVVATTDMKKAQAHASKKGAVVRTDGQGKAAVIVHRTKAVADKDPAK